MKTENMNQYSEDQKKNLVETLAERYDLKQEIGTEDFYGFLKMAGRFCLAALPIPPSSQQPVVRCFPLSFLPATALITA